MWGVEYWGVGYDAAIAMSSHALHVNLEVFSLPSPTKALVAIQMLRGTGHFYTIVFFFPIFVFDPALLLHCIYTYAKFQKEQKSCFCGVGL